jgi:hypothetical protein
MTDIQTSTRWFPIAQADRSITDVQDFSEVGIILRNSDRHWVRDADGRVYEASWTDDNAGYWWDWVGESPVDPIEFMPHPLNPRFATPSPADLSRGPADQIISQIEDLFPNWRSYRDLVDCITCEMHELRKEDRAHG